GAGAGRELGEEDVAVVVEVADDGDVHRGDDVGDGAGGRLVVHGHAHQLAARFGEGRDLGGGGRHVGGVGVGQGLNDDRLGAAHADAPDIDRHRRPARYRRHATATLLEREIFVSHYT